MKHDRYVLPGDVCSFTPDAGVCVAGGYVSAPWGSNLLDVHRAYNTGELGIVVAVPTKRSQRMPIEWSHCLLMSDMSWCKIDADENLR